VLRSSLLVAGVALVLVSCRGSGQSSAGARAELQAGGLTWTVVQGTWTRKGDALVGSAGHVLTHESFGDAMLELDVEQNVDISQRTIGIGFRYAMPDYEPTKAGGYGFNFISDRTFNAFRGTPNNWVSLTGGAFQPSPALQPLKNHLVIRMQGGTFTVTANGQPVTTFTDGMYPAGQIDLWVESTAQTVTFSNVKVTKL
jgi:Domain of Unknown Function (DUF1080)